MTLPSTRIRNQSASAEPPSGCCLRETSTGIVLENKRAKRVRSAPKNAARKKENNQHTEGRQHRQRAFCSPRNHGVPSLYGGYSCFQAPLGGGTNLRTGRFDFDTLVTAKP